MMTWSMNESPCKSNYSSTVTTVLGSSGVLKPNPVLVSSNQIPATKEQVFYGVENSLGDMGT